MKLNGRIGMKKQYMKSVRDHIPEPLKYITAPLFRMKLIYNNEFRNYLKLLENRESLDQGMIREYQFMKLKEVLIYSFLYVPYYRELFDEVSFDPYKFSDFKQIEKIPFLTRELVIKNFDKLISKKKVDNGYYNGFTGGSTGLPLKFLLDYDSIYKENAFIYHYRKKLGYNFSDEVATFRNRGLGNILWKLNPMHREIVFSNSRLSKITIKKYVDKINHLKPQYINGYISAIWYFTKLLEDHNLNLDFSLKGIFFTSENPDPEQRKFIENFFKVKSSTFYGHSERVVIAEEKKHDLYVFDPFYGYTEQIPSKDDEYTIVGTGFLNRKMPFIRYKTDDICVIENGYFRIEGKRNSKYGLYGINNEFLTGMAFRMNLEVFRNILTYQFIQQERGKADMLIIVNKDFQNEDMQNIKKEIYFQTNGVIDINIKIVDNLQLTEGGKFRKCISFVGN